MPPPKRPKSDVEWTAMCSQGNVGSHNESLVDEGNAVAVNPVQSADNLRPLPPHDVASAAEFPLDLRRSLEVAAVQRTSGGWNRGVTCRPPPLLRVSQLSQMMSARHTHGAEGRSDLLGYVKNGSTGVDHVMLVRSDPRMHLKQILVSNESSWRHTLPRENPENVVKSSSVISEIANDDSPALAAGLLLSAVALSFDEVVGQNEVDQDTPSVRTRLTDWLKWRSNSDLRPSPELPLPQRFYDQQSVSCASSVVSHASTMIPSGLHSSPDHKQENSHAPACSNSMYPVSVSQDSPSSTVVDSGTDAKDHEKEFQYRCQVCEDVASGFHYGVWSCEGCKAFFKRSLQGSIEYVCPATNTCTIDKLRRKSCQACRLRKCYESGMSAGNCRKDIRHHKTAGTKRKLSLDDSHRSTVEAATKMLHHEVDSSNAACAGAVSATLPHATGTSSAEERDRACHLMSYLQQRTKLMLPVSDIDTVMTSSSSDRTQLLTSTMKLIGCSLADIIKWAKEIPGFSSLSLSSRIQLLINGWPDVIILDTAWRSLQSTDAIVVYPGLVLTREISDTIGCTSLYTRLLGIVLTFKELKLSFNEFVLVRCAALLNADISILYTDEQLGRLRRTMDASWQLLFDTGSSQYQRMSDCLLTLAHVRQCGMNLASWLCSVSRQVPDIPVCDLLQEMLNCERPGSFMSA